MNNDIKKGLMIFLVLLTAAINIYFIVKAQSKEVNLTPLNKSKVINIVENVRGLKEALINLKERKPLTIEVDKSASSTESTSDAKISPPAGIKYKMSILNGSGKTGAANQFKDSLVPLENILEVTLGNTESTPASYLEIKSTVPQTVKASVLEIIKNEVKALSERDLNPENPSDIILIIGTNH